MKSKDLWRFWKKVKKTDDCWVWTAAKDAYGYGIVGVDGKTWFAHRYSWTLAFGPIPTGLVIRHVCNNPSCVRPQHLTAGTQQENVADFWRSR